VPNGEIRIAGLMVVKIIASPTADGSLPHAGASLPSELNISEFYNRYQELQEYVGWTPQDAQHVQSLAPLLEPHLPALVDDFYAEIERHPRARAVITGGQEQIDRLKGTLSQWLRELLNGPYDADYVARRWRVGWRHVEIGLDQVYTVVALARVRRGLLRIHEQLFPEPSRDFMVSRRSLNTLLDLDLAIVEDAYQTEFLARQQRAERLAAIGQVVSGIAHELRNPLNVVKTSVYFLLNAKSPSPAKVAEHLERIERHVARADGVITALSNFAKMPVPNLKPFSVQECLNDSLEANPPSESIQVVVNCNDSLPPALADRDQMQIVFANLIRNAGDAMSQGGGRLLIEAERIENQIEVRFRDNGTGIPPEVLRRVMEPLYSTKARGLGLGLAIARYSGEESRQSACGE
jgi:signal transduction histidine kinase